MTELSPVDTVFVFVHGAWHSSGQWAATQRALAGRGAASVAVDLPGHGFDAPLPSGYLLPGQPGLLTEKSPLASVTMDDCAEVVLDTLRQVRRYRSVVLVAHSAGGGPASLAAERAPELVDALVYLSAFVPAGRPRFVDYLGSPRTPPPGGRVSISATPRRWAPSGSTRSHRIPPTSRNCGRRTTRTLRQSASAAGARR